MEERKTFGAYVQRRRKELGMTQRQFAQKLYVTESAVSKWERGLSYPDITLLRPICEVLQITEHELLTGSEDSERRTAERLAQKYLQASGRWRAIQYIIYGAIVFGCFLGNVLSEHRLSWFYIALTSCMTAASITLVPSLVSLEPSLERRSRAIASACFAISVELLFLSGCAYSGGDWYFVGATGVLLGLTLVLLPFVSAQLTLPSFWQSRKLSGYFLIETALLILLLLASCLYSGGDWFLIASVSTVFGLGFPILPVLLRQMLKDTLLAQHKALLYFTAQTLGLFAVLICADLYSGADVFFSISLPVALICLVPVWSVMLAMRYLPAPRLLRASVSSLICAGWVWLFPVCLEQALQRALGPQEYPAQWRLMIPFNLTVWEGEQAAYNVFALIIFSFTALAVVLVCAHILRHAKKS